MIDGTQVIQIRGESLRLLPEGALFWPAQHTLVVADFHLGKAETFGQHGFPLPGMAQIEDLSRLKEVATREQATCILFLGDLIHTLEGLTNELIHHFITTLARFRLILVIGNHDRKLIKNWPVPWSEILVCSKWEQGPFLFLHELPKKTSPAGKFVWAGHIHPCVLLRGGGDRLRLKTFVIRKNDGLLPAFSSLAGGFEVRPNPETRLYPVAEGRVYELGY